MRLVPGAVAEISNKPAAAYVGSDVSSHMLLLVSFVADT